MRKKVTWDDNSLVTEVLQNRMFFPHHLFLSFTGDDELQYFSAWQLSSHKELGMFVN